jgi:putative phosphoesterase
LKTIGIISDTHLPDGRQLPQSIISVLKGVDLILHAGDIISLSVVEQLKMIAPLKAVHGNMCNMEVKASLPEKLTLEIEDLKIGLTHGSGGPSGFINRILRKFHPKIPDIIVCGHTHETKVEFIDDILFLNPGPGSSSIIILNIDKSKYTYEILDIR